MVVLTVALGLRAVPSKGLVFLGGRNERFRPRTNAYHKDTPQNCRYNYGNAIYVPTYKGYPEDDGKEGKKSIFSRMQSFFERDRFMEMQSWTASP